MECLSKSHLKKKEWNKERVLTVLDTPRFRLLIDIAIIPGRDMGFYCSGFIGITLNQIIDHKFGIKSAIMYPYLMGSFSHYGLLLLQEYTMCYQNTIIDILLIYVSAVT